MISPRTILEPLYVVDTHALIWYLTDDRKLGRQAKAIFAAAERGGTALIISAVVIAELYYANQKQHWFPNFAIMYRELTAKSYFQFVDFQSDHVLDFAHDERVPEMHDRIIAGLARRIDAPLLTSDPLIQSAAIVRIVW